MSLRKTKIEALTISELLKIFPMKNSTPPLASSWSTTKEDIAKGNYYPLWKNPHNPLHKLQWEHLQLCFDLVKAARDLKDNEKSELFYNIARPLLDKSIHSCQFWWANFGRMWDINLINKGLVLQEGVILNAFKSIRVSGADKGIKRKMGYKVTVARKIAARIRDRLLVNE